MTIQECFDLVAQKHARAEQDLQDYKKSNPDDLVQRGRLLGRMEALVDVMNMLASVSAPTPGGG